MIFQYYIKIAFFWFFFSVFCFLSEICIYLSYITFVFIIRLSNAKLYLWIKFCMTFFQWFYDDECYIIIMNDVRYKIKRNCNWAECVICFIWDFFSFSKYKLKYIEYIIGCTLWRLFCSWIFIYFIWFLIHISLYNTWIVYKKFFIHINTSYKMCY